MRGHKERNLSINLSLAIIRAVGSELGMVTGVHTQAKTHTQTQHNFQHFVDLILVIQTQVTCTQVIAIKFIKWCIVFIFTPPHTNLLVNVTTMAVSCNLAVCLGWFASLQNICVWCERR